MDANSRTAPDIARELGVSLPRVHRLLDAEGCPPAKGRGHARQVTAATVSRLLEKVGTVPNRAAGLDRVDMLVLAAVSRASLGLESARAVARAAGVSPTAAAKSLTMLEGRGLIRRRERRIVRGRPRTVRLWHANPAESRWTPEIAQAISQVVLPAPVDGKPSRRLRRIPARFAHLFWNADFTSLSPAGHSDFIASRMMTSDDPDAWVWATANLPPPSLGKAATLRGLSPRRRALIENLTPAVGGS